jgi:hypothetical protein
LGVRQALNAKPVITVAAAVVIMVVALIFVFQSCSETALPPRQPPRAKEFFSIDDGAHWFAADNTTVPPFQHEGKPAYRAKVFKCADGKEFCAWLERYSETDRKRYQETIDKAKSTGKDVRGQMMFTLVGIEVKRPGEKEWVKQTPQNEQKYTAIRTPKCADGSTNGLQQVMPPE